MKTHMVIAIFCTAGLVCLTSCGKKRNETQLAHETYSSQDTGVISIQDLPKNEKKNEPPTKQWLNTLEDGSDDYLHKLDSVSVYADGYISEMIGLLVVEYYEKKDPMKLLEFFAENQNSKLEEYFVCEESIQLSLADEEVERTSQYNDLISELKHYIDEPILDSKQKDYLRNKMLKRINIEGC